MMQGQKNIKLCVKM